MDEDRVLRSPPEPAHRRGRWKIAVAVTLAMITGGLFVAQAACESQGYDWFWLPQLGVRPAMWGCENTDE